MLAVGATLLGTTLLSVLFAGWRARRSGAEMISGDEYLRRNLAERADRPVWESMASIGLMMSFTLMVMMLAVLPIGHW